MTQQDSTRLPAGNSTESESTAEQQIKTPGPLQNKGNSEKGHQRTTSVKKQ